MAEQERPAEFVQSVQRALDVIKSFTPRHPSMTLTEVAERTDLTRGAARRFLLTLEHLGYVRSDGRQFSLSPAVLELGYAYLSSVHPWDAAYPLMEQLSNEVEENCLAGVLEGTDVVCVARTARRLVTVAVYVGGRVPASASSMGRAILAYQDDAEIEKYLDAVRLKQVTPYSVTDKAALREELAKVREQGWSVVKHELEEGLISVSAPVFGMNGRSVAALNISAHGHRLSEAEVEERILPPLLRCARETSLLFGHRPQADPRPTAGRS
ncbi:MAG: helix-turn-helix domain-containing protein [Actinomycetota bacterium]|nr:helix-turn-helix domain-containing protein [Actinomycetota bacterium]